MKKFEVLLIVNNRDLVVQKLSGHNNITVHFADDEEAAIEQMHQKHIDIIVYEGSADFALRNKLKSLKTILAPDAVIIEYDQRNIHALPDDLEMAMQDINKRIDGKPRIFDQSLLNLKK